jgi:hypothetical protein
MDRNALKQRCSHSAPQKRGVGSRSEDTWARDREDMRTRQTTEERALQQHDRNRQYLFRTEAR